MKVLIIEDDLLTAHKLQTDLKAVGHEITALARNLQEAVISVKKNPPDLAIIDIVLGDKQPQGTEVSEILQELHPMPHLYLTGYNDSETLRRAEMTKPYSYLLKPYRVDELVMQIKLAYDRFKEKNDLVAYEARRDSVFLKTKAGHKQIAFDNLLFVKSNGNSSQIYIRDHKQPLLIGTHLGDIDHYFQHPDLLKISKSLIINKRHIAYIGHGHIAMGEDNRTVNLSPSARKVLSSSLNIIKTKSGGIPEE